MQRLEHGREIARQRSAQRRQLDVDLKDTRRAQVLQTTASRTPSISSEMVRPDTKAMKWVGNGSSCDRAEWEHTSASKTPEFDACATATSCAASVAHGKPFSTCDDGQQTEQRTRWVQTEANPQAQPSTWRQKHTALPTIKQATSARRRAGSVITCTTTRDCSERSAMSARAEKLWQLGEKPRYKLSKRTSRSSSLS